MLNSRPVLSLVIRRLENLLAFDTEDLEANATRSRQVVGQEFGRERRVAHDAVVGRRLGEHALSEMLGPGRRVETSITRHRKKLAGSP